MSFLEQNQTRNLYDAKKDKAVIRPVTPDNPQQCLKSTGFDFQNMINRKLEKKREKYLITISE